MPYQYADGYDNAGGLADIAVPFGQSTPITPGVLRENGNGVVIEDGKASQQWIWSFITYDDHDTLLTQLGMTSTRSKQATIRTRQNEDGAFANYNAILTKREGTRSQVGGYSNFVIDVTGIEAI